MVGLLLSAMLLASPQDTLVLSLDDAVSRAILVSPAVAAAKGAVLIPAGERGEDAWPFPDNPYVEYERVRRQSPDGTVYDYGWKFTQQIELIGWAKRRSAAGKRVAAAEAGVLDARRRTALEAQISYVTLQLAQRRVALADSNAVIAERLAEFARERLAAGEVNRLEYNTAVLEAARARSQADRTAADLRGAEADLARVLAVPADSAIRTVPLPDIPALSVADEAGLLSLAISRRPDLEAALRTSDAAQTSVTAAKVQNIPNIELSARTGLEEGFDDLLGFSVSLSVPLFHRQQANLGRARAEREVARAALVDTRRRINAEVVAAAALYARARDAERRFAAEVLVAASQNVELTGQAFEAGEVSVTEVVVLRATAVATLLEYLEVLSDAYQGWFLLAAVLNAEPDELSRLLGAE